MDDINNTSIELSEFELYRLKANSYKSTSSSLTTTIGISTDSQHHMTTSSSFDSIDDLSCDHSDLTNSSESSINNNNINNNNNNNIGSTNNINSSNQIKQYLIPPIAISSMEITHTSPVDESKQLNKPTTPRSQPTTPRGSSSSSKKDKDKLGESSSSSRYSPLSLISPRKKQATFSTQSIATDATWLMIVSNWEEWSEPHFRPLLTKYVYQGIPDRFRPTIWFHLSSMIPQRVTIPACTDLAIKHSLIDKASFLTPLSTPSTATPITTPVFKSQSSSSILLPTIKEKEKEQQQSLSTSNSTSPTTSPLSSSSPTITNNNNNNNNNSTLNGSGIIRSNNLSSSNHNNHHHKCFYHSILKHHSEHEEQIDVDIQRTFPDVAPGLRDGYSAALKNVLTAISLYDTEMGYCQGISFVGSILVQKVPEEEAFHILLHLLEGVMRDFYVIGMRGLKLRLYQMSKLVKELFPKLHQHLERIDLDYTIFASPWFLTVFSYHLSEDCNPRILDVILLQGIEAFFSVGLAIFQIIQDDLLSCTDSSQAMEYFRRNAKDKIDVTTLMDTASRIGISTNQLSTFAQQFEMEQKPNIPTEFNPDQLPKEKMKDPNWVVKKYQLKEHINNLEEDLAVMKRELHYNAKKNEEEKFELVKHLQELSDRESTFIEQRRLTELNYQALLKENEALKTKLQKSEDCNNFLAQELKVLQSKMDKEIWNNNPKNSIKWS